VTARRWAGPTSVRARLTLWYAGTVALVLLGFAGATWLLMRQRLYANLDDRLHAAAEAVEHGGVEAMASGELGVDEAQAWDASGTPLLIGLGAVRLGGGGRPPSVPAPHGPRTEAGARVLVAAWADPPLTVAVAASETPLRNELLDLGVILAGGVLLAVALAAFGGWFLAARALAPVDRMAWRARAITAQSLSQRIDVKNPRDELGRLAIAFNEMIARLEASFLELQRFTADASHELRTPLAALRAVGEVALRHGEAGPDTVASMLEEAERLARLVDGLLELARAPHRRLETARVDLGALARGVADELAVLAEGRRLSVDVTGGPVHVRADEALLRRAVVNLVDNALRHGGTRVDIAVARNGATVSLSVADDGPGIPPEHRERIFERFTRIDEARSRGSGGTGLGLALARAAVQAHGGRIDLDAGPGAVFRIVLPAAASPPPP